MNTTENKPNDTGSRPGREHGDEPLRTQEKTTLGGSFNSGVTSDDEAEKEKIQKRGGMADIDQSGVSSPDTSPKEQK